LGAILVQLVLLVHREPLELLVELVLPDRLVLVVLQVPRVPLDLPVHRVSVVNKARRVLLDLREFPEIASPVLRVLLDHKDSLDNLVLKVQPGRLDSAHRVLLVKQEQPERQASRVRLAKRDHRDQSDLRDSKDLRDPLVQLV